jgi:hypothetical protein
MVIKPHELDAARVVLEHCGVKLDDLREGPVHVLRNQSIFDIVILEPTWRPKRSWSRAIMPGMATHTQEPAGNSFATMVDVLRAKGHNVEVHPSVVSNSPHEYAYIFLDPVARMTGPHILISERSEWEDAKGWLIGAYLDWEQSSIGADVEAIDTLNGVLAALPRYIELLTPYL